MREELILVSTIDGVLFGLPLSSMDYYLTQPPEIDDLIETIDKICRGIIDKKDEDSFKQLDLDIGDRSYFLSVTSRRLLELLISTHENALRQKQKLRESKDQLELKLKEIQAAEDRFRTLVQTVPDIVYRLDERGNFIFLNDAVSSLGYKVNDLIGKHFSIILVSECLEQVSRDKVLPRYKGKITGDGDAPKLFDERRCGDRRTRDLEVLLFPKQGGKAAPASGAFKTNSIIFAEVNSSGLLNIDTNEDGICIGTLGVIRDISERKRAEQEIKAHRDRLEEIVGERTRELMTANTQLQQEVKDRLLAEKTLRHFQHIVASSTDMMALLDKSFTYLAINNAYLEAFGLASGDIIGHTVSEILGEEFFQKVIKIPGDQCLAGERIQYQAWFDFPVAGNCFMDVAYFPYVNSLKKIEGFIVTARDISEKKRYEAEREELHAQVIQSQKLESIGTLAGGVAHEINNPVNGILNYAQLIRENLDAGSKHYEFASEIIVETERVAAIVRNLLTFARQDEQSHSPARMTDIVRGTTTLIQTVIRGDMIELDIDVPENLPELKCRSQQIQQVIMNLLTNARDALNQRYKGYDENKIIKIKARSFKREGRRWIRTTVEDHGAGIPEEVLAQIFDPFYTTKDRNQGTGLGLSISHGIVEDHHGELNVESVLSDYTRFHLDLPVDNGWDLTGASTKKQSIK